MLKNNESEDDIRDSDNVVVIKKRAVSFVSMTKKGVGVESDRGSEPTAIADEPGRRPRLSATPDPREASTVTLISTNEDKDPTSLTRTLYRL